MKQEKIKKYTWSMFLSLIVCMTFVFSGCGNKKASEGMLGESGQATELSQGDQAPDFTAEVNDGSTFSLTEQKDKVILLNFWATWCGPCVEEMPAFEKLYQEYGDQVAILAVNSMEDKGTVDRFIEEKGYTFPIAYDEKGEIISKYPTDGIPYTLVIGKDGTVKKIYIGAKGAEQQYEEYKSTIDSELQEVRYEKT